MTWFYWIGGIYLTGFVIVFVLNFMLMVATGGLITLGLVIFRAFTWPFFWTSWWRGEPNY